MRIVLLFCLLFFSLQGKELTPMQLKLLKDAGFSKQLSKKDSDIIKKEQIVENKFESDVQKLKKDIEKTSQVQKIQKSSLDRFASNFFNNKNRIDPYSLPIPPNYMITRGDTLSVNIYGGVNESFSLKVDRQGTITIPQVGELKILGLTFDETKDLIIEKSKEAYPSSTNILVNMDEFTAIQVTLSGLVKNPGLYNLSSFSTIKDALMEAGGISNSGSFRNILLKRNGRVIKTFDLYKLVKYGSSDSDTVLQSGDIIYVKSSSKNVSLSGDVDIPAIYELKNGETFKNLISFASGLKASANKKAITLKRYSNNSNIKVYTLSLAELYRYTPKNGDEIYVPKLSNKAASLVTLSGNVTNRSEIEIPKDKKLSTLFKRQFKYFGKNGIFKKNTNFTFAKVENIETSQAFNLRKLLNGEEEIYLKKGDNIIIYSLDEIKNKPFFYISGDVVSSSKKQYEFYEGLRVKDLFSIVVFANEENEKKLNLNNQEIDLEKEILNVDKSKIQIKRVENNRYKIYTINTLSNPNFSIKPYDVITFFAISQVNNLDKASIRGEVFIPKTYDIDSKTTINDLVKLAGGFTKKASKKTFELVRYHIVDDQRVREVKTLILNEAMNLNMRILPDDEVTIRRIANWYEKQYVQIKGQVKYPGRYAVSKGERLSSLIQRAGGFTEDAFLEGSVFTRKSVQKLQMKRLRESMDRLKRKSLYLSSTATEAGETKEDKVRMMQAINELEKEVEENEPIGRVSINIYHDLKRFVKSDFDITLEDKDALYIPTINDTVSVVGEVLNQNTFVYRTDLDVKQYINRAGGMTDVADTDMIYVVKANGEAMKYERSYFFSDNIEVFKGDTIVVPLKLDPISDIKFAKDVTSILYQLAVTAASLKTVGSL